MQASGRASTWARSLPRRAARTITSAAGQAETPAGQAETPAGQGETPASQTARPAASHVGIGPWRRARRATALAAVCAVTAMLALSGCSSATTKSIAIAGAYIPQPTTPGSTVAYLDIRNSASAADRLVSASTSVGGQVGFLAPGGMRDGTMVMHLVQDISVPGNGGIVRLNPNSYRLRITGAGPMHGGKDVILKLKFVHAGTVSVDALVTDPESGGGSYFLN